MDASRIPCRRKASVLGRRVGSVGDVPRPVEHPRVGLRVQAQVRGVPGDEGEGGAALPRRRRGGAGEHAAERRGHLVLVREAGEVRAPAATAHQARVEEHVRALRAHLVGVEGVGEEPAGVGALAPPPPRRGSGRTCPASDPLLEAVSPARAGAPRGLVGKEYREECRVAASAPPLAAPGPAFGAGNDSKRCGGSWYHPASALAADRASPPGLLPEGIRSDEEGHPSAVRRGDRALQLRQHVHHAQHQEGAARRALLAVPPVLHGQAEARGLGRPRRPLQAAPREEGRAGRAEAPKAQAPKAEARSPSPWPSPPRPHPRPRRPTSPDAAGDERRAPRQPPPAHARPRSRRRDRGSALLCARVGRRPQAGDERRGRRQARAHPRPQRAPLGARARQPSASPSTA